MTAALASTLDSLSVDEKREVVDYVVHLLMEAQMPVPEDHLQLIRERREEMRRSPEEGTLLEDFLAEDW